MNKSAMEKLTILYEHLSKEDERENESVSIENQKAFLEEYAIKNGFTNFIHLTDDGWSGTRWDRPQFLKMVELVEGGTVGQILIKDMSRLGRDHLRVGLFLEQLREKGVRLIAVAESIDTANGEDDFMPFRNLFAEWHARDTSRKIRAINNARIKNGKRVTGALPYGYLHDPNDRQQWILDEVAAPIVKRIFHSIIEGKSVTQISEELTAENLLTPAAHWTNIGEGMAGKRTMQVDIYLNFIGKFEVPYGAIEEEPEEELPKPRYAKKLRKDMTEEELEHYREYDRQRYAKKKAARLAEEEKRRTEILTGTNYEGLLSKAKEQKIAS